MVRQYSYDSFDIIYTSLVHALLERWASTKNFRSSLWCKSEVTVIWTNFRHLLDSSSSLLFYGQNGTKIKILGFIFAVYVCNFFFEQQSLWQARLRLKFDASTSRLTSLLCQCGQNTRPCHVKPVSFAHTIRLWARFYSVPHPRKCHDLLETHLTSARWWTYSG